MSAQTNATPPGPVVVDTSVHISSEVFGRVGSPAREVLARGFADHFQFAVSPGLLLEITRKMIEFGAPADDVAGYVGNLRSVAELFEDADPGDLTCADPNDLFVLALGRTSAAWCIVAQDVALRDADAKPPGWTPGFFLARLRELRGEPESQRFP